jgi:hypothetical protein
MPDSNMLLPPRVVTMRLLLLPPLLLPLRATMLIPGFHPMPPLLHPMLPLLLACCTCNEHPPLLPTRHAESLPL